ncbi:hypothetical protein O6H91_06G140200 [Diphasiastrum complanatum]|uniref:Uncharacterized protein n=1 Tax=Diphasiastrum complanatum TaxID=34168 RepID=A0ACC2DJG2_DIPCM|nr:hypothetical protein O6H91_06G140200 [Diphasiastrum complanatum]
MVQNGFSWSIDIVNFTFGGILVVLGGEFRQILSVIKWGDHAQVVGASLKYSPIWSYVEVHRLKINMRVLGFEGGDVLNQREVTENLLRIGDGREHSFMHDGVAKISLPRIMCLESEKVDDLIAFAFPNIMENYRGADFWRGRSICTPLNDDVDFINAQVTKLFPGDVCTFYSANSVVDSNSNNVYPMEFLNTLQPSGCPPHKLVLKEGMIVILLCTLAYESGICNGTRLIVQKLGRTIIEAEIVTGGNVGTRLIISGIPLVPTNPNQPFEFRRLQFPMKPVFTMSINKSEGQTMDAMGLYLSRPIFSHGQFYVALLRVRSASCVKVLIKDNSGCSWSEDDICSYTENVIYKEVLQ